MGGTRCKGGMKVTKMGSARERRDSPPPVSTFPPHLNIPTHPKTSYSYILDANPNSEYMNSALDARNIRIEGTFASGLDEDYTGM